MTLFRNILAEEKSLPRDQSYKDLVVLINFILRQFFKAVKEDSFLLVEAFYPKTRGKWKQLSSWEPPSKKNRDEDENEDDSLTLSRPAEVKVKKGYSWSEQLGIVIKCLVEDSRMALIDWTKQVRS